MTEAGRASKTYSKEQSSIGSIIKGVLEIYGTTNFLTVVYPVLGIALFIGAVIVYCINSRLSKNPI